MKRITLLLFIISTSVFNYAHAQLAVDAFTHRVNDMSAMSTDKKGIVDQNGDPCALIKVFAPRVDGFSFYGGAQSGFLTTETHGSEIWVYVPASAQRITISHASFGRLEYEYPIALSQGAAYQMLLNVGGGRFVTINSNGAAQAKVAIDGRYIGETPVYNHYLPYGRYHLSAVKGRYEGETDVEVVKPTAAETRNSEGHQQFFNIQMIDQTPHYGDVTVSVENDPHAEIFYQGERVGAGTWKTMLKEGVHEVVTRKADCSEASTVFAVTAQEQNTIKANPPTPYTGNIQIYTRPRSAKVTYDNNRTIDLTEARVMPVGTHQFTFTRKDYNKLEKEITVLRDQTTTDTISLTPINYIKNDWAFYFGAGYTFSSLPGVTGYLGCVFAHFDMQLSYTYGTKKSNTVYMYTTDTSAGNSLLSGNSYRMHTMAARLGYQFRLIPRLSITPQVGYMHQMLSASAMEGSDKFADGAAAQSLSFGVKVIGVPVQHLYFFVAPEYALPIKKDSTFGRVADAADFHAGGLSVSVGIHVNFGNK